MRWVALVLVLALASSANAKVCTIGCPCGNTCIDCDDVCHVDDAGYAGDAETCTGDCQTALIVVGVLGIATLVGLLAWYAVANAKPRPSAEVPLDVVPTEGGALVRGAVRF